MAELAPLPAPHEPQARPVLPERRDLDVDEPERQRLIAYVLLADVAVVTCRAARPGDPERAVGEDRRAELCDRGSELSVRGEEGKNDVLGGSRWVVPPSFPVRVSGGSSDTLQPAGAALVSSLPPGLQPSFFQSGVPEYPVALIGSDRIDARPS